MAGREEVWKMSVTGLPRWHKVCLRGKTVLCVRRKEPLHQEQRLPPGRKREEGQNFFQDRDRRRIRLGR